MTPLKFHLVLIGLLAPLFIFAQMNSREAILKESFIFERAPFQQCHASTIVESHGIILAAWFGGPYEKHPDVGIWLSRYHHHSWTIPIEVANGVQHNKKRYPCWNPVLFQPVEGPLMLFYKVGPSPGEWWGMLITSLDTGKTWSQPHRLPEDIYGPIKNKPIQLPDGTLLCPSSTEHQGWRAHFERTSDEGVSWELSDPVNDGNTIGIIQPALFTHSNGQIQALCRSQQKRIVECWSPDNGKTWSEPVITSLPNPNSGLDGVTLSNGWNMLVYNHTETGRSPLNIGLSKDGIHWKNVLELENSEGEYSYPAVIQTSDGLVHLTYTYNRLKIKHVILDPARILP